jgi:hypothetical protein
MKTIDENFAYGYGNAVHNLRDHPNADFKCYYARAKRTPASFRDECVRVCEKISDYAISQNRIPYVLLSGGLDSEIVVRSYVESNRDFRVVTNRFLNDLNSHEIEHVENLCNSLGIKPHYIDIDVKKWLVGKESSKYAQESQCVYAEMLPTMKLMNNVFFKMNGTPVLGNGDLYVSKEINPACINGHTSNLNIS